MWHIITINFTLSAIALVALSARGVLLSGAPQSMKMGTTASPLRDGNVSERDSVAARSRRAPSRLRPAMGSRPQLKPAMAQYAIR
jgi:hypothetical protein